MKFILFTGIVLSMTVSQAFSDTTDTFVYLSGPNEAALTIKCGDEMTLVLDSHQHHIRYQIHTDAPQNICTFTGLLPPERNPIKCSTQVTLASKGTYHVEVTPRGKTACELRIKEK